MNSMVAKLELVKKSLLLGVYQVSWISKMISLQKFYLLKALVLLHIVLLVVQRYTYKSKAAERPALHNLDITNSPRYSTSVNSNLWTKKVQLCIMFNLFRMDPNETAINVMLSYYNRFFNHIMIIFDGKWKKPNYLPENVTFSGCNSGAGWFEHECLRICLNEKWQDLQPEGYLFIADDIFINLLMMSSLPLSQTWYVHTVGINYTARALIQGMVYFTVNAYGSPNQEGL